jgi:hypothetical protein
MALIINAVKKLRRWSIVRHGEIPRLLYSQRFSDINSDEVRR